MYLRAEALKRAQNSQGHGPKSKEARPVEAFGVVGGCSGWWWWCFQKIKDPFQSSALDHSWKNIPRWLDPQTGIEVLNVHPFRSLSMRWLGTPRHLGSRPNVLKAVCLFSVSSCSIYIHSVEYTWYNMIYIYIQLWLNYTMTITATINTTNYTILYYTILYYTILYYTVLYCTILYYTVLYYTILH